MGALYKGMFGAAIIAAVAFYYACTKYMGDLGHLPHGTFTTVR
jgi:K(+)-stimulated pyrophosphate-energized sodium pump